MPVTATLISVGVSSATSIYGANKSANAAKDAAKTQEASGNKALALQEQQYKDQVQRQRPYAQAGENALAQLQLRSQMPRQPMPMFNGNQQGGGWTPQNFGQQQGMPPPANPYAAMFGMPPQDEGIRPQGSRTVPWGGPR